MKFNVLGACALVAAAATATSSTSPILGVESVSNDYRELLRLDCKGVLHFLHGTPFETDWDLTFIKAALDTYRARIKERALARCPDITEEEINRRLAPSLDLVFNYLFGDDDKDTYETCTGTFNDGVLQLGAFTNLITAGTCMNSYVSLDISDLFPITCSPPSWNQDGTCFVKGKFSDVVGGMEINVAATNCSADSAWPFLSLHCQGASCVNYFKPCSDVNSVTQCGDTMKCTDLGTLIGSSVDIEQTITSYLAYAGLWHESIPSSNVWTAVVRPIREFWGSYFSGAQVGANKNDYLKFCFPKPEYQGKTYNDFFSMIGEVLYYEEEVSCTYLPGCAPPANCPNPFYEFGCNPMTGKKSEDSLNVTLLFKTIDEKELALDAARDYLFTGECSEEKNLPVGCLGKDITIKNTGTYSYLCHAASNGRCGFHMIGDGFCDPACDREECSYDGVDCLGPAEKVAPQIRLYTCDISEKEMIASNSPCIDSYQNSICIQKEIDLERYQSTSCAGPTGPTNQDCCTCNDTTIYTAVPKYDLRSEIVEFKVSGNLVFPWDGKIGNLLVTSQKDLTTEFPVSTYTQGETKFVSLDCNGFATFSLVTPFARAKATGLLATVKFAEQAVLSIAKLRQQNQPGGTFVGADGYFTKLGYQHFGVFTLAYPLWQYTTAIRHEARGADFTKYEGTTPGSLLMREWDPKKSATVSHLVVGDIPSSCSFSKYVTDKTCMLQYSVPILTKIGVDLKIKGGVAACPNTHIPQISSSISGTWLNPFPFISPCLNNAGCPSSHECVNIFEYVNTIAFTTTGKKLPDLEYDLFSLILFGKAGRDPNWGARTSAWSTEDAVYILRNWFGGYKNPNPFTPTPNYNLGEVKLCFPKNDPVLVPILKTGVPYDWGTAGQDVNWTTTAYESDPKFNVSMEKISFVGLSSLATQPPGIVDYSTPPPTKSPTTVADVGAGAQSTFNGFTAYAVASIALIISIMFAVF